MCHLLLLISYSLRTELEQERSHMVKQLAIKEKLRVRMVEQLAIKDRSHEEELQRQLEQERSHMVDNWS
jgi:hypothetical protein